MNASNWIELAGLAVTLAGGGSLGIAKLTRIAVAVESLIVQLAKVIETQQAQGQQVQAHESRITTLEATKAAVP